MERQQSYDNLKSEDYRVEDEEDDDEGDVPDFGALMANGDNDNIKSQAVIRKPIQDDYGNIVQK